MRQNVKAPEFEVEGYHNLLTGMPLFDLRFLVSHVLAHDRVKLLYFHFIRHCSLIFCRRVGMSWACRGDQLNLISHSVYS